VPKQLKLEPMRNPRKIQLAEQQIKVPLMLYQQKRSLLQKNSTQKTSLEPKQLKTKLKRNPHKIPLLLKQLK